MKLDGTDQRQVTTFGSMAGRRLRIRRTSTSSSRQQAGFEGKLFIVDTEGKKEPVRITCHRRLRQPAGVHA